MKSRLRHRWIAAFALVTVVLCGCAARPSSAAHAFEVLRLDGTKLRLVPEATVRAWVFVFVGADCPISNRCLPELVELARESGTNGVRFVFVYPNADESAETIRQHQREFALTNEVFRDPSHELARRLSAHVTPEVVAVTVAGRPIYRGRVNDQYLALGQGRPAPTRHDLAEALKQFSAGMPPAGLASPPVGCTFRARP